MLQDSLALMPLWAFVAAIGVTLVAGFVKGAVGFAMPLVMISGLSLFIDPLIAIAGIILPIVHVEFPAGDPLRLARDAGRRPRILALHPDRLPRHRDRGAIRDKRADADLLPDPRRTGGDPVADPASRRAVSHSPEGDAIWRNGPSGWSRVLGGLTGTWGPPTVLYLIALETPKAKQILVQGVVYGLGSVSLLVGHVQSGVLNMTTCRFPRPC
jgi:hypothetical protein